MNTPEPTIREQLEAAEIALKAAQNELYEAEREANRVRDDALHPFRQRRAELLVLTEQLRKQASPALPAGTVVTWQEGRGHGRKQKPNLTKRGVIRHVSVSQYGFITYRVTGYLKDGSEGLREYRFTSNEEGVVRDTYNTFGFKAEEVQP